MATLGTTARPAAGLGTWFQKFREDLFADMQRRRVYSATHAELSSLSDRELADIGVSREQIADIARDAADGR